MKHNKKHSFSKCHQCNFNSYDKRATSVRNTIRLQGKERKIQAAQFDCIDVKCKREGDHYLGWTSGDGKIHSQEVAKEMLRVVLEVVAVLVKRR